MNGPLLTRCPLPNHSEMRLPCHQSTSGWPSAVDEMKRARANCLAKRSGKRDPSSRIICVSAAVGRGPLEKRSMIASVCPAANSRANSISYGMASCFSNCSRAPWRAAGEVAKPFVSACSLSQSLGGRPKTAVEPQLRDQPAGARMALGGSRSFGGRRSESARFGQGRTRPPPRKRAAQGGHCGGRAIPRAPCRRRGWPRVCRCD